MPQRFNITNKGGCAVGRKKEPKGGCKTGKKKKQLNTLDPEFIKYYKFTRPSKKEHQRANSLYSRTGTKGEWEDEGNYSFKGTIMKLGFGKYSKDRQSMTWENTLLARLNKNYIPIGEGKKKIKFNVKKADPIPINNREGLEIMLRIPYKRVGGIQGRPEDLLEGIKTYDTEIRYVGESGDADPWRQTTAANPEEPDPEDELAYKAGQAREELSGVGEGFSYDERDIIGITGEGVSVADFIHLTQNFTQVVKEGHTIAYGDENDFDAELNQDRHDEMMTKFREEHPDEDEYPDDYEWDTNWTYDKSFFTQQKEEDFPELLEKMNVEKQRVFIENPEFAEYFNRIEAHHGEKIKRKWDEDMEDIEQSPFTLKEDVSTDFQENTRRSWGGLTSGESGSTEDIYFYNEESMDTYFGEWKGWLEELVLHHSEKKQYLNIHAPMEAMEAMEEIN